MQNGSRMPGAHGTLEARGQAGRAQAAGKQGLGAADCQRDPGGGLLRPARGAWRCKTARCACEGTVSRYSPRKFNYKENNMFYRVNFMSLINIGGPMPDGSIAQDMWVNKSDFVCASGAMLSQGPFNGLLGKLCLTRTSLVMLPYEGLSVELVKKLAALLQKTILGPYAGTADKLQKLGLYPKGMQTLDKVLAWPLSSLDEAAIAKDEGILFIRGGASLIIKANGQTYSFSMSTKGHESHGFASAQDFRDYINRLQPR